MNLEDVLASLVNFECGLITYVSEVPGQPCEPGIQIYVAEYQDPGALHPAASASRILSSRRQTSGAGLTREEALWATLGEAIERYSASSWRWREETYTSAANVPGGTEFLERAILYQQEDYGVDGFAHHPASPEIPRGWIIGEDVLAGEPQAAPSCLCCMMYEAQRPEEILDRAYSTGLASHVTKEQACLSGLLEVVERDAFASYWAANIRPKRLVESVAEEYLPSKIAEDMRRLGLKYSVLMLPTDIGVPVFACILELAGGGIATGASANLDVKAAIGKAVVECLHTYNWCLEMKRLDTRLETSEQIQDFKDHVAWYLDPERSAAFYWAAAQTEEAEKLPADWAKPRSADPADQLKELAERIAAKGKRAFVVDMTPPDMRFLGFNVWRAFVPGLQPLSAGHRDIHTDLRRLKEFADYLGVPAPTAVVCDPPHSFP